MQSFQYSFFAYNLEFHLLPGAVQATNTTLNPSFFSSCIERSILLEAEELLLAHVANLSF